MLTMSLKVYKHGYLCLFLVKTWHSQLMVKKQMALPKGCLYWLSCFFMQSSGKTERNGLSRASQDLLESSVLKIWLTIPCWSEDSGNTFKLAILSSTCRITLSSTLFMTMPLPLKNKSSTDSVGPKSWSYIMTRVFFNHKWINRQCHFSSVKQKVTVVHFS